MLSDKIKRAYTILEIAERYTTPKKSGRNYFILCPFHDDTNPSMSLDTKKNRFKCFACGARGSQIDLFMRYEGIGLKEAIHRLAKEKNIASKEMDPATYEKKRGQLDYINEFYKRLKSLLTELEVVVRRIISGMKTMEEVEKYSYFYHMLPLISYYLETMDREDLSIEDFRQLYQAVCRKAKSFINEMEETIYGEI